MTRVCEYDSQMLRDELSVLGCTTRCITPSRDRHAICQAIDASTFVTDLPACTGGSSTRASSPRGRSQWPTDRRRRGNHGSCRDRWCRSGVYSGGARGPAPRELGTRARARRLVPPYPGIFCTTRAGGSTLGSHRNSSPVERCSRDVALTTTPLLHGGLRLGEHCGESGKARYAYRRSSALHDPGLRVPSAARLPACWRILSP